MPSKDLGGRGGLYRGYIRSFNLLALKLRSQCNVQTRKCFYWIFRPQIFTLVYVSIFLPFKFPWWFLGDFQTLCGKVVMQDLEISKEQQVSQKRKGGMGGETSISWRLIIIATIQTMTTIKTNFQPKMVVLWRCKMRFRGSEVGRSGIASKTVAALMVATVTTLVVCFKPPASTHGRGYEPPWNLHAP